MKQRTKKISGSSGDVICRTSTHRTSRRKKNAVTTLEKELVEMKHEISEVTQRVEDIQSVSRTPVRMSFFKLLTYNVWFALLVFVVGISAIIFGPRFFHVADDIAKAGTGTQEAPFTVCASGCDYTTIQNAISNGHDDLFVTVGATYDPTAESSIMNVWDFDHITLDCQNSGAVIGIGTSQHEINIQKDNVTIQNCIFNNVKFQDRTNMGGGYGVLGFTLQNNTFATSTASSIISFSTATTTNPTITSNTGDFNITFSNITGGTVTNNTITNYTGTNKSLIDVQGSGFTVSGNTLYDYTGYDNTMIGNSNLSSGIESSTITGNYMQYVSTVSNFSRGGISAVRYINVTSTSFTSNYIILPSVSPSSQSSGFSFKRLNDVTISNNTVRLMSNGWAINLTSMTSSTVPDADFTYNLLYTGLASATGTAFGCDSTVPTTTLSFDYNGVYNFDSNFGQSGGCLSSVGANSKTTNPYLKTDDADTSNDFQLAPFSNYLNVNGETDIGAYSAARGNSFAINPSGTIDYSTVHATTTGILALAKSGDTYTLAAGTYDPFSFSSLNNITITGTGVGTIINGSASASPILLTGVTNSTFQNFIAQNASSTVTTYTVDVQRFLYDEVAYEEIIESGLETGHWMMYGTAMGEHGPSQLKSIETDNTNITDYVGTPPKNWDLALTNCPGLGLQSPIYVREDISREAFESMFGPLGCTVEYWGNDVLSYNGSNYTFNDPEGSSEPLGGGTSFNINKNITAYAGIKFAGASSGNTVSNVTSTANSYGFWFSGTSASNNVNDSIATNSVLYDLYSDTTGTNNAKNTSFTVVSTTVSNGGQINVYEKFRAYVLDGSSNPISGATVTVASNDGSVTTTLSTDGTGYTSYTDYILAFILNDDSPLLTQGGYNPFSLTALKVGIGTKTQSATISSQNQTVSVTIDSTPSDPTNVVATNTDTTIIIVGWSDNSTNETSFLFDYITGSDGNNFPGTTSTVSASTGTGTVTTSISGLVPNTGYLARVKAVGSPNSSNYSTSSVMYTNPTIPASVTTTANGQNSIIVSWNAPDNPSGTVYELYNVTSAAIATNTVTSTSYTVTGLVANTEYGFKVRARYASSNTLWSAYSDTNSGSTNRVTSSTSITLGVNESIGFELTSGGSHTATLNSITGGVVSLTVASTPTTVSLSQGSSTQIDTNGNGSNDMTITATTVGSASATFTFADYIDPNYRAPGGSNILSKTVALSGIVVNGVTRAITNIPSIFVTFLGIDNPFEYILSSSVSFAESAWTTFSGKTVPYELPTEEGTYTLYGKVRDAEGNTSVVRSAQVTYDTDVALNPPVVISPDEGLVVTKLPFKVEGMGQPFATISLNIAGTTYTVKADDVGAFSITVLDQLVAGEYTVSLTQANETGSESPAVVRHIVVKRSTPVKTVDTSVSSTSSEIVKVSPRGISAVPVSGGGTSASIPTVGDIEQYTEQIAQGSAPFLLIKQDNVSNFFSSQVGVVEVPSGGSLEVLLRPDQDVHSIVARLYLVSSDETDSARPVSIFKKLQDFFASAVYAKNIVSERKLIKAYLFEHLSSVDAYKGVIDVPLDGRSTYQLAVTLVEKNGGRIQLTKEINTIPEGILYSGTGTDRHPPSATVKLYEQKQDGTTELWNGALYGVTNPLLIDSRSKYSFSVPAGEYYLVVEAPRHEGYTSSVMIFSQPSTISEDIHLTPRRANVWETVWDWIKSKFS